MKKVIVLLLVLVLSFSALAILQITEVMYNPEGSDNNHEFIEIYSEENVNLSNWVVGDTSSNDSLVPLYYFDSNYSLIVEKDFDFSNLENVSIYSAGAAIGNNLNNKDEIYLFSENLTPINNFSYDTSFGGNNNGYSICLINNSWLECLPTPGTENIAFEEIEEEENQSTPTETISLSTILAPTLFTNLEYTKLFGIKIGNKDNCSRKDNITVYYNVSKINWTFENNFTKQIGCSTSSSTGNVNFNDSGDYVVCGEIINFSVGGVNFSDSFVCTNVTVLDTSTIPCNLSINITFDNNSIYEEGDSIKYKINLNDKQFPFKIDYWIEDLFENIVKSKVTTTNTNKKSWKTSIEETDRVLLVKSTLYPSCNDNNTGDNYAEKMFIVTESIITETSINEDGNNGSEINIVKVSPTDTNYGDLIKVDIEFYKGETSKYSISAYVEKSGKKVSETTKINLKDKFTNYKVTLPIQLKPNCNSNFADGEVTVVVGGLDALDTEKITLSGVDNKLCKDSGTTTSSDDENENDDGDGGGSSGGSSGGTTNKLSYQFGDFSEVFYLGEEDSVSLVFNGDNSKHDFEIWAYLYRGSKCYSCYSGALERDDNLVEFSLDDGEDKEVVLPIRVDEGIAEGEYKMKVKIRKDDQKTVKDLIKTVSIKVPKKEVMASEENESSNHLTGGFVADNYPPNSFYNKREGIVVYESSSVKAKKLIPYILFISFGLLSLVLVWKRK